MAGVEEGWGCFLLSVEGGRLMVPQWRGVWKLQVGISELWQNTRCGMSKSLFLPKKKISKEVYLKSSICNT
jgi:hypothetical protein